MFAGWIARRFPDRKWSILDRERGRRVGRVHERAAFLPFASLPAEEQTQLGELLRNHLLPIPGDLNQMLLAAFDAPR